MPAGEADSIGGQSLTIDGTVEARSKLNFFEHYDERHVVFEAVEESDAEKFQIRGYKSCLK